MTLRVANIMEEGRFSGQHKRILAVGKRLRAEGIHTIVYFPRRDSEFFEARLRESGIDYRRMALNRPTKSLPHLARYLVFFFVETLVCCSALRRDRVDLVHCNGSWQIKGVLAAKLAGKKVVWHLNDTKRPRVIKLAFRLMAARMADTFIVASRRVKAYYLDGSRLGKKGFTIIQAPVDTEALDPEAVPVEGLLAGFEGLNIVSISNVNPAKGLEHFVDMAHRLNRANENLHFHVVGSIHENQRPYWKRLCERAESLSVRNLHFHGFTPRVEAYLKEADIFVCSSLFEASPTSVWEAMSMGKAIVSTDVGDVAEMLEDGAGGFVVETGNGAALAEKVQALIDSQALRDTFGRRARERAVDLLGVDRCVGLHKQAYVQAARGCACPPGGTAAGSGETAP